MPIVADTQTRFTMAIGMFRLKDISHGQCGGRTHDIRVISTTL